MAFTAKIKLSVNKSNESAFRRQIQSLVDESTQNAPIKIKHIKFNITDAGSKLRDLEQQIGAAGGITVELKDIDSKAAIAKLRDDIQKMLSGLNIAGLKDFLGDGVVDEITKSSNAARAQIMEASRSLKTMYNSATHGGKNNLILSQNVLSDITSRYNTLQDEIRETNGIQISDDRKEQIMAEIKAIEELIRVELRQQALLRNDSGYQGLYNGAQELLNYTKGLSEADLDDFLGDKGKEEKKIEERKKAINDLSSAIDKAKTAGAAETEAAIRGHSELITLLLSRKNATEDVAQSTISLNKRATTLKNQITNFATSNGKMYKSYKDEIDGLLSVLNSGNYDKGVLDDISSRVIGLKTIMRETGQTGNTFFQTLQKGWERFGGWSIVTRSMMMAWNTLKRMVSSVKELDTAMTELKKVTDLTDESYQKFLESAVVMSKKVGASLTDTVSATADFARLGYSINEAASLAEAALVYKNVGDGVEIDEATNSIISTIKAFEKFGVTAQNAMSIVDKFNEVGNNFAITSTGIGDALQKSAAALAAAGNNLEESIALITGMNSVIQNPEVVGTTIKTITMYLRAAKTEAEEAGESTEGMANSVSELREEILTLTGKKVDIMLNENEFKSTIQVMRELSNIWDSIADVDQANILNLLGGKRNANAVASLLENFDDVEAALASAQSAAGSATAENEKWMDSITGKLTKLETLFESISNNIINSDLTKFLIDVANELMRIVELVTKLPGGLSLILTTLSAIMVVVKTTQAKNGMQGIASGVLSITDAKRQAIEVDALKLSIAGLTDAQKRYTAELIKKRLIERNASDTTINATLVNYGFAASAEAVGAGAKAAATGVNLLKSAVSKITLALTVISLLVTAYEHIKNAGGFDWLKSSAEKAEEALASLKERAEEVASISKEFQSLKKSADEIIPRYAELSEGVNKFGEKTSRLTDEEYSEFLSLTNQLADMFPQLNMGLDENGNAMLALAGDADTVTSSLQALLEVERQLANEKIAADMPNIMTDIDDYKTAMEDLIKESERYKSSFSRDLVTLTSFATGKGVLNLRQPKKADGTSYQLYNAEDIYNALKDAGLVPGDSWYHLNLGDYWEDTYQLDESSVEALKKILDSDISSLTEEEKKIKLMLDIEAESDAAIAGVEKEIKNYQNKIESAFSYLNSVIQGWLSSDYEYQELPQKAQDIVNSIVKNLNFKDMDDIKTDEDVKKYIEDNVISPIYNAMNGEGVEDAFNNIFNLKDKLNSGKINIDAFKEGVSTALTGMFDSMDDSTRAEFEKTFITAMNAMGIEGTSLAEVIEGIAHEWSGVGDEIAEVVKTQKTYNEVINTLTNKFDAFSELDKIFSDIKDGGNFEWDSLFTEDFVTTFSGYGDAYNNFIETVTSNTSNVDACREAFNRLASEMIKDIDIWGDLSESTKEATIAFLEQNGVTNARIIVERQLEVQALKLKYSTEEEIETLYNEAAAGSADKFALAQLYVQKLQLEKAKIDSEADIDNLINLANAAIATTESLARLSEAKEYAAIGDDFTKQAEAAEAKGNPSAKLREMAQNAYAVAAELAGTPIEFDPLDWESFLYGGKPEETQKKIEKYIADIDAYYAANQRLEQAQREKEHINTLINTTDAKDIDSLRERISLESQLVDIYNEEAEAERVLIEQRTQGIQDNVSRLQELGFEVSYDPEIDELRIDNLENINTLTAESTGEYKTLQEATNAFRKEIEETIDDTEALNDANASSKNNILQISKDITTSFDNIKTAGSNVVGIFSNQLSEVTSAYKSLHTAVEEYNELGYITVDTFQSIMSMETKYLSLLMNENGAIELNTGSIYRLVAAKMEDLAITKARALVETIKQNLANADALRELADATYDAAEANWALVYSELAALGLEEDLYDSFKSQIDAIRDLTESAKNNIGNMYDKAEEETEESVEEGTNAINDYLKELQSALDYTLQKTQDLIEYEINQQSEALQDQIDKYREIIDLKKESLDKSKEESDYEETVAEKVKEIAELQAKIDRLSLDTSRESQAEKNSLLEELAELQKELADTQSDHAIEKQKEQLDKMAESYEEQKQGEIDKLEESISSAEKIYQLAIERINSNWNTLYDDILEWNTEAGNDINKNIVENWEKAAEAVRTYGSYLAAVSAIESAIESEEGSAEGAVTLPAVSASNTAQSSKASPYISETPQYTYVSFDDMFREQFGGELDDFLVEVKTNLPYLTSNYSGMNTIPSTYTDNSKNNTVFEPHIEVNITGDHGMSDEDARQFGEQIADATLDRLYEAFERKGIANTINSRTK